MISVRKGDIQLSFHICPVPAQVLKRSVPPPSISLCSSSKEGSFRIRAEMSVQRPMAQRGDSPLLSPKGVMSKQATSCSISVWLNKEADGRGKQPGGKENGRDGPPESAPDLPELLRVDLQVVERPAHGDHHLAAVAGGHADVLALRLLPLAD